MLRVLQTTSEWLPQTAAWLYNQIRFLPEDLDCHVSCERAANLDQFPVAKMSCLEDLPRWRVVADKGMRRIGARRHLRFLADQIRKVEPQVLHSHFGHTGWRNSRIASDAGVRHVVSFYGYDLSYLPKQRPVWRTRYLELFAEAGLFLCEGPHMAGVLQALGCPPEKIRVHRLGVDTSAIEFRPRTWTPEEPLRVLLAGTFREKKGHTYALQALGHLRKEVDLEITIIGDATSNPRDQAERARILETLDACGLRGRTRLMGFQPYSRLFEEAYRHHVFVSPSVTSSDGDTEGGSPVTITEMVATGMPVLSSTHCDIPQVVQHGVTGLLAPERDVDALVEQLRVLVGSSNDWESMLKRGRRHVEQNFNCAIQGGSLGDVYHRIAEPS